VDIYSSIAFIGAMFLLAITPGPGLFVVISRALANGFSHASVVIVGLIVGDIIYLLLAIYGLGAIAQVLGDFFIIIKYLGAFYLIYLGYKIWTTKTKEQDIQAINEISWKENFLSGLFVTLGNPKVIIFYLGFLPAFMNLQNLTNIDVLIAVVIVTSTLAIVMLFYAYLSDKSRMFFKSKKAVDRLNKTSGAVMITAGGILVFKN